MILDLLVLGLGIRAFIGAVQLGRQQADPGHRTGYPASAAATAQRRYTVTTGLIFTDVQRMTARKPR